MRRLASWLLWLAAVAAVVPLCSGPAVADEVEDFYRGKTIYFIVSTGPGGGYDIYARPLAQFMSKHIPGHPNIVVQNMVGGGGLRAINYLYSVAPSDGTYIGLVHSNALMMPLQGVATAKFDSRRFSWIGSMNKEGTVCIAWHTAPVKTFADLQKTELVVGATGAGSGFWNSAVLVRNLLGAKLKIVSGYDSGPQVLLAIQKGETQGTCGIAYASIAISLPDWLSEKKINFLLQTSLERSTQPDLANVPMALDLAKNDEQRTIMEIMFANGQFDRPILAPPAVPAARLAALRAALKATMEDPDFMREAAQTTLPMHYVPGEEVQALISRLFASPPSTVAAVEKAMTAEQ
jgi:tripartite-type tricarboxylate transporter receptor subunit TctC